MIANSAFDVQTEIFELEAALRADRERLLRLTNPTPGPQPFERTAPSGIADAVALRAKITEAERRLTDLRNARDVLVRGENERRDAEERRTKWRAQVRVCRSLKAQHEKAELEVLAAKDRRDFSQTKLQAAIQVLNEHGSHPPDLDSFPLEEDFAFHDSLGERLKQEQVEATAEFRHADDAHLTATLAMLEIRGRFEAATLAERNLRPPDATR